MRIAAIALLLAGCRGVFGISPVTEQDAGPDQTCTEGDVCSMPPGPECISDTVRRTYDATGTCTNGMCSYETHDEQCAAKCEAGACVCPVGQDNWPVDVGVAALTARVTINGAAVPSTTDYGNVFLRTASGDEVTVGTSYAASSPLKVVPGIYDVYFDRASCGTYSPCNLRGKVSTVTIAASTTNLPIDIPVANVTVNVTIGGAANTSTTDYGTLYLRTASGDELRVGPTYMPTTQFRIIPGTYEVHYEVGSCSIKAPCNTDAILQTVTIAAGASTLNIDVPVAAVTRSVTVGGAPLTTTTDYGSVFLRTAAGDELALGQTYTTSSTFKVVPGTYRIDYERGTCGVKAPCNRRAAIKTVTIAPTTTAMDIDVPTATVTRNVKIDGAPVTSTTDYGTLSLRTAAASEDVSLSVTYMPSASFVVVPGTYDVYYQGASTCSLKAPCNKLAKVQSVTIPAGPSTANIDIPTAKIGRTVTVNGLPVTDTADYGNLFLRTATGDELLLGPTYSSTGTDVIVAGTYDLEYEGVACLPITPCNKRAKIKSMTIAAGTSTLALDVPLRVITRHATIAGAPVTDTTDYGTLFLRAGGDEIVLDPTYTLSMIQRIVPGTYNVFYEGTSCEPKTPCNRRALLGCITF
jgi:hypothetical protein